MNVALKTAAGVAASILGLSLCTQSATAQSVDTGTYQAAHCNGANALFERAQGTEKLHDIGNTKLVGVLTNSGVGTAGFSLRFTNALSLGKFKNLSVDFLDDGTTHNAIAVHL